MYIDILTRRQLVELGYLPYSGIGIPAGTISEWVWDTETY